MSAGLIGRLLGLGDAAQAIGGATSRVAEVFTPNATRKMELSAAAYSAALAEAGEEFRSVGPGRFDRAVNGLNRLPRPLLALGTLGLFVYAMVDPASFSARMLGLATVPEPLWWLLGAVVSFYFGAREAFHSRNAKAIVPAAALAAMAGRAGAKEGGAVPASAPEAAAVAAANPALDDWRGEGD